TLIRASFKCLATKPRAPGLFSRLSTKTVSSRKRSFSALSASRAFSKSETTRRSFPRPETSGAENALMFTPAAPSTDATRASAPGLLSALITNCCVVGIVLSPFAINGPVRPQVRPQVCLPESWMACSSLVAIEPPRGGAADVPHCMPDTRRNQHLFSPLRPKRAPLHLQFQFALQYHQQLIRRMRIVNPFLSRWIHPQPTTKASGTPVFLNLRSVQFRCVHHIHSLET